MYPCIRTMYGINEIDDNRQNMKPFLLLQWEKQMLFSFLFPNLFLFFFCFFSSPSSFLSLSLYLWTMIPVCNARVLVKMIEWKYEEYKIVSIKYSKRWFSFITQKVFTISFFFFFYFLINYLVDGSCRMFAYGVSAYWSMPRPLSFELSQWAVWAGRKRLPGNTLPGIRAAECSLPGNVFPGCRFDGIRNTLRCTRDVMVDPVDIVIRITKNFIDLRGMERKKKALH